MKELNDFNKLKMTTNVRDLIHNGLVDCEYKQFVITDYNRPPYVYTDTPEAMILLENLRETLGVSYETLIRGAVRQLLEQHGLTPPATYEDYVNGQLETPPNHVKFDAKEAYRRYLSALKLD